MAVAASRPSMIGRGSGIPIVAHRFAVLSPMGSMRSEKSVVSPLSHWASSRAEVGSLRWSRVTPRSSSAIASTEIHRSSLVCSANHFLTPSFALSCLRSSDMTLVSSK